MPTLDDLLYNWICRANMKRDDLDLLAGVIEDSLAFLKGTLGIEYLEQLLLADNGPIHVWDDEANPLRKWLFSARVDDHIVQVLELAAYLRVFKDDAALHDKVEKLKHDRFWPIFFELAMAARARRACRSPEEVRLNPEVPTSVGDFSISVPGYTIPCECSRLGRSPQVTDPNALQESLTHRIGDGAKRISVPLCIKIRSAQPLTGSTYNNVLRLIRNGLADARRLKLPNGHNSGSTTVTFEELTETCEPIPKYVDGKDVGVGAEWQCGMRLYDVPAKDRNEISDRFDQGERFYQYESVRLFMKFGNPTNSPDHYARLTAKLRKKLKQTKTSAEHLGKVIFVEVPFDLQCVDSERLEEAVRSAMTQSRTALAIILANRQGNPQFRYHYSQTHAYNRAAAKIRPDVLDFFDRLAKAEMRIDPILGLPYRRSWSDAEIRTRMNRK